MKKGSLYLLLVLSLCCVCIANASGKRSGVRMQNVKIYYLPFNMGTYMPVTESNIVEKAHYFITFPLQSDSVNELRKLISEQVSGAFDSRVVRLKVEGLQMADIYVDKDGGIKTGDATDMRLRDFEQLKVFMERLVEEGVGVENLLDIEE